MNYLAHSYLSFGDPGITIGNLVSDFVKGKKKFGFPENIQKGITLHRTIDSYTDTHESTRLAKEIFRPAYRLYSGAIVDVVFDHFLANDPSEFSETSLFEFSQQVYRFIEETPAGLPENFLIMFPYMRSQNWLFNYRHRWGIERSLGGLVRRARYLSESKTAFILFETHYQRLSGCYHNLWNDLRPMARKEYELLTGSQD